MARTPQTCSVCQATVAAADTDRCPACGGVLGLDKTLNEAVQSSSAATVDAPGASAGSRCLGPRLGLYEIVAELGHGGMGRVYRARQPALNRVVALKTIRAGELAE